MSFWNKKNISRAVINRLPRYYRYLGDLMDAGISRISSKELSRRMNITASQIRQDLNHFGCFGQQGYGYNVEILYNEIQKILGLEKNYGLIIVGAGNIGQALANYVSFERRGFQFLAMFDVNPKLIGMSIRGIPILDADEMKNFIEQNRVDIGVLALPGTHALQAAQTLFASDIKAIWNFSNVDLQAPTGVRVENVHLTDSLMTLVYGLNEN